MNIIHLKQTDSTNSFLSKHAAEYEAWTIVYTDIQSAGRGQRGNNWESEPGKNLTFSVLMRPEEFLARNQFSISEAVALAVAEVLRIHEIDAKVKWPNDIYVGAKKIAGILIEHSVIGMNITSTIAGVGLNVNQTVFRSDAPNPVSMTQISGIGFELEPLLKQLAEKIKDFVGMTQTEAGREELHQRFKDSLWRRDGEYHSFREPAESESFDAKITDVEPTGYLHLESRNGKPKRYAFKEIIFESREQGENPGARGNKGG